MSRSKEVNGYEVIGQDVKKFKRSRAQEVNTIHRLRGDKVKKVMRSLSRGQMSRSQMSKWSMIKKSMLMMSMLKGQCP